MRSSRRCGPRRGSPLSGSPGPSRLGTSFAIMMSWGRWVERSFYPWAVVLQTLPLLAIVPVIGFWFQYNFKSRVIVCVLISLFPIITNTLFGLKSVDQAHRDLFKLHKVGRFKKLVKLEIPSALPPSSPVAHLGRPFGDRRHCRRLFLPAGHPRYRAAHPGLHLAIADGPAICRRNRLRPVGAHHLLVLWVPGLAAGRVVARVGPAQRLMTTTLMTTTEATRKARSMTGTTASGNTVTTGWIASVAPADATGLLAESVRQTDRKNRCSPS